MPSPLGGLCFKPGDSNKLLIGGNANSTVGAIYEIGITRTSNGYISGFAGSATLVATAPNIDGGLCEIPGSGGTLVFTTYSNNSLGQLRPDSTTPDSYVSLSSSGIASSTGTCQFVPAGFPGAGNFVVASYNGGTFNTLPLTQVPGLAPHTYTFTTSGGENIFTGGGPEGIVYVPLFSPIFNETPTMLVCEYSSGRVSSYDVDPAGLPVSATRRDFITGLSGAEGGCLDPVTNSLLFSTFGGNAGVVMVPGFNLPPCGPADIGRPGGLFGPDGLLNNNDFIVYIDRFFASDPRADIGVQGGVPGSDGAWDNNDFVVFIEQFFAGCTE
ncbi:MAG: GC-type dockerin domain-anchored protein [Phycisphaerales bacterium]|nr:GC-type dockerin domain-anchored protein [Phycisphaerales bacterium]